MNKCTEKTGRWPDTLTDVSPGEVEAFLAHADACLFHAEKLHTEEEGLRSMFRLARGLDKKGRILQGRDLKETIEEHDRRHAIWKETAQRKKLPFKCIYLSNSGEYIAGSGKFYDFRRYEGAHSLDLQSGLQIWGEFDYEGKTGEALLGVYSLTGVRHTSRENLLPLDNGYTVGLKVNEIAGGLFKIEFRCVENEALEKGWDGVFNRKDKGKKVVASKPSNVKKPFFGPAIAYYISRIVPTKLNLDYKSVVSVATSFLFLVGAVSHAIENKRSEFVPATDLSHSSVLDAQAHSSPAATMVTALQESKGQVEPNQTQQGTYNKASPPVQNSQTVVKPDLAGSAILREQTLTKNAVAVAETENNQSSVLLVPGTGVESEKADSKQPLTWYLQSYVDKSVAAAKKSIVHTGRDKVLRDTLFSEIHQRDMEVVPINSTFAGTLSSQQFTAKWDIIRRDKSVTVEITLTADGSRKILSFRSEGTCSEQACEEAVRDAVSGVYAVIDQTEGGQETRIVAER